MVAFAVGSAGSLIFPIAEPGIVGSHAVLYTDAAAAWLAGGNPWSVGPPSVVFAGPPTMLVPFVPFVFVPTLVTRLVWVVGMGILAVWAIRRLGMPGYWIGFAPVFENIILGHPELLVLALLVVGGAVSGLAALMKPYAGFALLAERRWSALALAAIAGLASLLVLPWARFIVELPMIGANLARQGRGGSVFGDPVMMVVAVVALASLGPRRALWLVVPVLWPFAQEGYKVMSMPVLSPILAAFWAIPVPSLTLIGLVAYAVLFQLDRRGRLPGWLSAGIQPVSRWLQPPLREGDSRSLAGATAA
jgi:hypothetical protein